METEALYDCMVNIQYVAEFYGVSKQTVRNWIKAGMPHVKRGNVIRLEMHEVKKWMGGTYCGKTKDDRSELLG